MFSKTRNEFLKWITQPPEATEFDGYYHGSIIYKAKQTKNNKKEDNKKNELENNNGR